MIEFGKTLREAREAKGYSVSQLADVTHILPQIIENLEREDFTKIVAPIYGRGFVKLYCETVGLDAKPLIDEFMAIYNGNRPPVIRLKEGKSPASVPPPAVEMPSLEEDLPPAQEMSEPVASEPPAARTVFEEPPTPKPVQLDLPPVDEPPPIAAKPFARPVKQPPPFAPGPDDLPFPEEKPAPKPKREFRLPSYEMPQVPRSVWRFGILIVAAAAVLALIFFGCRALYRATMRTPETAGEVARSGEGESPKPETRNEKQETRNEKPETRNPAEPRKPIPVSPLYID